MSIPLLRRPMHRRELLRGVGSIAIGLPLLEAMGCDRPEGGVSARVGRLVDPRAPQHALPLQRFIATTIPNGVVPSAWFPTGGELDFTTGAIMDPLPDHGLPGLAEHRDDLVILKGMWHKAASLGPEKSHNEGHSCTLTGTIMQGPPGTTADAGWTLVGPSLDQYLAGKLEEIAGAPFARKTLPLVPGASFNGTLSWDATGTAIPVISSVTGLFDELFGLASLSAAEKAALRLRRHSVLDGVIGNYEQLQTRLGASDKARLEAHLDALRAVEQRIDTEIVCDAPDAMAYPEPEGGFGGPNLATWADAMQDLLVLAFSCDVTRVATLSYRYCGGGNSYLPWLGFTEDYDTGEHHEMSHRYMDPLWDPALVLASQWFCGLTAQLIGKLKATPEGSGTLFDSVILFQGSDVATGHHTWEDMPYLLAGSGGGVLPTGRYLQLPTQTPHNALLVSLLQAFGLPDTSFGDAEPNSGALPGLLG
ncbi:MAG TPA: DUF1552 domain-containing protein [Nannocystaceae bacterium]|nr:DUF1552 domain-containing protein [Nannocystaceae bacterium]